MLLSAFCCLDSLQSSSFLFNCFVIAIASCVRTCSSVHVLTLLISSVTNWIILNSALLALLEYSFVLLLCLLALLALALAGIQIAIASCVCTYGCRSLIFLLCLVFIGGFEKECLWLSFLFLLWFLYAEALLLKFLILLIKSYIVLSVSYTHLTLPTIYSV